MKKIVGDQVIEMTPEEVAAHNAEYEKLLAEEAARIAAAEAEQDG